MMEIASPNLFNNQIQVWLNISVFQALDAMANQNNIPPDLNVIE